MPDSLKIKICGLRDPASATVAVAAGNKVHESWSFREVGEMRRRTGPIKPDGSCAPSYWLAMLLVT